MKTSSHPITGSVVRGHVAATATPRMAMRSSPLLAGLAGAMSTTSAAVQRRYSTEVSHPGSNKRALSVRAAAAQAEVAQSSPMTKHVHGFTLVQEEFISEYGSQVGLYKHDRTGAQVMSVVNSDENKTFGVTFRTPVSNSRGVPHILEHSVLCGSRKYPIKEPFVELIKGSLNTFLNAFTYPDRTCYPVASANLQDFYNLIDVYLDAVLHPNCIRDPQIFAQEGWHLELEDPSEPLTYKGVVFNEMKGVYSSPDSVNGRVTQNVLFPDTSYAKDSGGDPADIPDLTFEEFKAFYESYYHPSNARFWFYGDDPADERLRLLSVYLDEFDAREVDSTVHLQKMWDQPKRIVEKYAVGESDGMEEEPKSFVSLNWLLTEEPLDLETELGLGFLNYLMLGTSASPLRKALTDSGLGESLIGGGVEDELCQPVFSIGLKGVKQEDAPKVESLVMETLEKLEKEGFASSAIEAAINTIEFSLRENNTGRFPRGLSLMLRAMSGWIYDRDPFRPMKWQDDLLAFKARLESGEDVFSPLIRKYLLDNSHRATVELNPDESLGKKMDAAEKERLEKERQAIGESGLVGVVESTLALKEKQETPDAPEALSCVPSLSVGDIPKKVTPVPTAVSESATGVTTLAHDIFTNDVLYLDIAFDLKTVPADLLHLVPLFCRSLTQMGTDKESFIELTERIGRKTGGISVSPFVSAVKGSSDPIGFIMVRGKTMADKAQDMLDIIKDVVTSAKLDDQDRFKQMVLETKSSLEGGIIGSGHSFAGTRLDAQRSVSGWVGEEMGGVAYLEQIRRLVARVDSDWEGVKNDLETIRTAILQQKGAMVNLTGDEGALTAADKSLSDFWSSISPLSSAQQTWSTMLPRQNTALVVPTQVNYVCKGANLYEDAGYELSGSSYVINKLLGTTWIWDRVRVSGGAYGGFCDFDTHSGMFSYLSYRDPNLLSTVDVYDGTVDFLRNLDLTEEELQKSIVGTIGDIDSYQLPDSKGRTAFMRHLMGITEEQRQIRRDEVLGTSIKDFREFAEVLDAVRKSGQVVAVTSPEKAELANKERPGFFQEIKRIL
jgi:Zn-dependent M16 (insulinase) family peptidase